MPTLLRRPLSEAEARAVSTWRYLPPYDLYDPDPGRAGLFLDRTPDGNGYYPAVDDEGTLCAFAVLGQEARVRGQRPVAGTVDVGLGVRPDAVGRRLGSALLPQVVDLTRDLFEPAALRVAVATFNERSLALCRSAGFGPVRDFTGPGGRPFRELRLTLD